MKKILKGFTLIELIVVMAILVILMAGIMNMFKPIRETYVDATLYESQRTTQNGIVQYITESVRYATDLGVYTKGTNGVNSVTDAAQKFTDEYLKANGVDITDPANNALKADVLKKVKQNAEVLIIDNTNGYAFGDEGYVGRILRRKFETETSGGVQVNKEMTTDAEDPTKKDACRLALGDAYYGASNYTISFDITQDPTTDAGIASDGIKVTVASYTGKYSSRDNDADSTGGANGVAIATSGLVLCKNLDTPINGMFDTLCYDKDASTGANTKVYIVYLNEKIDVTAP